jgi:gamma-glutamylcyclotransferase (GGCT)/AIG2-like uncharacterized protein YtfP
MSSNVFTYGSLMFAPVWERVVRGTYRSAAATLSQHRRFALADETYPGMIAQPGADVTGVVYFDVDPADLLALDRFEGEEYRRICVPVQPLATGGVSVAPTVMAETYLFEAVHRLSALPWEPEAFALQRFLDSYCRDWADKLPK